jgi:arginine N-succinyltransferase
MSAIVRPVRLNDLDRLDRIRAEVDAGMLTMPMTREAMEARVDLSIRSFARPSCPPEGEAYFLMMEEAGEIVGTAAVFTNLGADRPFYSYRISRDSKVSPELAVKCELDLLHLVNDYHGDTELGTLYIDRRARGGGRGRLLSYARLMMMASDPLRFGSKAMAEIRGFTDAQGRSPFWDAVGAKFFRMDYRTADTRSARDHRFIADLMPRYPIYADLLPEEARSVIAKPHPDAQPAMALLLAQGFHFNNVVDIFDAGPCVEAFIDQIDIVRACVRCSGHEFAAQGRLAFTGLVCRSDVGRFVCTQANKGEEADTVLLRLEASSSDEMLFYPLREKRA